MKWVVPRREGASSALSLFAQAVRGLFTGGSTLLRARSRSSRRPSGTRLPAPFPVFVLLWFPDQPDVCRVSRFVVRHVRTGLIEVDAHSCFANCYLLRFFLGFAALRIWQHPTSAGFCVECANRLALCCACLALVRGPLHSALCLAGGPGHLYLHLVSVHWFVLRWLFCIARWEWSV